MLIFQCLIRFYKSRICQNGHFYPLILPILKVAYLTSWKNISISAISQPLIWKQFLQRNLQSNTEKQLVGRIGMQMLNWDLKMHWFLILAKLKIIIYLVCLVFLIFIFTKTLNNEGGTWKTLSKLILFPLLYKCYHNIPWHVKLNYFICCDLGILC